MRATGCIWVFLLLGGCSSNWRPPLHAVQLVPNNAVIDLTRYAPSGLPAARTYRRTNVRSGADTPGVYERVYHAGVRTEGVLADREVAEVSGYLGPDAPLAVDRWKLWPEGAESSGAAFLLEFDPPLTCLPASIEAGHPTSQRVALRYFNRDGRNTRRGWVERACELEGYQAVEAGGVRFDHCARLKIDTKLRIHRGPRVDVTEYVWLAPGVGEVRRTEKVQGWTLLLYFDELHNYELLTAGAQGAPGDNTARRVGEAWSCCAVFLDRLLPHPRLGGLIAELVDGKMAPPTVSNRRRSMPGTPGSPLKNDVGYAF